MPLVTPGAGEEEPVSERHERARKVKPQYLGGELVKAGWARNQAEAELIQGYLLEEGIPSVQRRTQGFDVPEFLAGGPRDVLVPRAAYEAAHALLADADLPASAGPVSPADGAGASFPTRLGVWIVGAAAGAAAIVYALYRLTT